VRFAHAAYGVVEGGTAAGDLYPQTKAERPECRRPKALVSDVQIV
jgi:hypothetical protein